MNGSSESPVELHEYDSSWAEQFEVERGRIAGVFDGQAVGIEHIGSTADPGLCAKPIVDVLAS